MAFFFFFKLTGRQSDPHHLWIAVENKKNNKSPQILQGQWLYFLASSPLCSIKEPGIQTPVKWLFWDISLPPSQSTRFPNKVAISCFNTTSVRLIGIVKASSMSLNSVRSNTTICGFLFMWSHTKNKFHHKLSITNSTFENKHRGEFNLVYH